MQMNSPITSVRGIRVNTLVTHIKMCLRVLIYLETNINFFPIVFFLEVILLLNTKVFYSPYINKLDTELHKMLQGCK